jgi:hypothetical protein
MHRSKFSRKRDRNYCTDMLSPLRSALICKPICMPVSVSTAPFSLLSTIACPPTPSAAPAPAAPGHIVGAADIADGAAEVRCRAAEQETRAQATNRDRIAPAVEIQHAAATGRADKPAALDYPTLSARAGETETAPAKVTSAITAARSPRGNRIVCSPWDDLQNLTVSWRV